MGKVTMQMIAEHLGISRFAVSRALSGGEGVSAETRRRVIEAAERLGYVPPGAQRGRDHFRKRNILFMVEQERFKDQHFWPRVIAGVETAARQRKLNVMLATVSEEQEARGLLLPPLLERTVDGALVIGEFSPSYLEALRALEQPVVLVDMDGSDHSLDAVLTSDRGGSALAVRHLAALGHQAIGFIGDLAYASSFRRRYQGFLEAKQELGLVHPGLCILGSAENHFFEPAEIRAALEGVGELPTAFLCANDRVALALITVLQMQGLKVPEDVSIVGFDNIDLAETNLPGLTTLHVHKERMGARAVEMLAWRLENPDAPKESVAIETALVVRESTSAPRASLKKVLIG